jgi:hypothetical protein
VHKLSNSTEIKDPLRICIAAGINHRDWRPTEIDLELDAMKEEINRSRHEIIIAGIPIPDTATTEQQATINYINGTLQRTYAGRYIEPPGRMMTTAAGDPYKIHHTQDTTDQVMNSIFLFLD